MQKKIPLVIGYGITGKSLIEYLSEFHKELILIEDSSDRINVKDFNDLIDLYCSNCSEADHWMEYFVEYSGLGGQIGINWSNL